MYRIIYVLSGTRYAVYEPFDETRKIISGIYRRETNTIGELSFSVLFNHPVHQYFDEYSGIIELYWNNTLLYKFRITRISRNLYNTMSIECEGLLGYLNDSIVKPYVFNENNWIYPILPSASHNCTVPEFVAELIAMHNLQVSSEQQFSFIDETDGAFDNTEFTTSQTSYVKTWSEIESKVIKNIGGYIQLRFVSGNNQVVLKAELTESNNQSIRYSVNLKDLEIETVGRTFATALWPVSTYTDANGRQQTVGIYNVNNGRDYVQNDAAVNAYGRIIEYVGYEGIVDPNRLKAFAVRDLSNYISNFSRALRVDALDMSVLDSSNYTPLEVDKKTVLVSEVNGINTVAILNAFSVNILDPASSQFTFNSEIPSFVRKAYTFRR